MNKVTMANNVQMWH